MSSYSNYIADRYASELLAFAPEMKDSITSFANAAKSGKFDDTALYQMAKMYQKSADSLHHKEESKEYYMKPFVESNGVIRYVDMNGHGEITIYPQKNGLYSIKGPEKLFEIVGGRGMLSTFIQNLDDGDFFHNKAKQ
jgi:hypothetical protein